MRSNNTQKKSEISHFSLNSLFTYLMKMFKGLMMKIHDSAEETRRLKFVQTTWNRLNFKIWPNMELNDFLFHFFFTHLLSQAPQLLFYWKINGQLMRKHKTKIVQWFIKPKFEFVCGVSPKKSSNNSHENQSEIEIFSNDSSKKFLFLIS